MQHTKKIQAFGGKKNLPILHSDFESTQKQFFGGVIIECFCDLSRERRKYPLTRLAPVRPVFVQLFSSNPIRLG